MWETVIAQNVTHNKGGVHSQIHLRYAAYSIPIRKFLKDPFMIFSHWEMTTGKTKRHHLLTNDNTEAREQK